MIEFSIIEGVVDGRAGFGPHLVEVWCAHGTTKRQGQVFVTLFTSVASWAGEQMRIEEFAKQVAINVSNVSNTGNWEIELGYNIDKQRWVAMAKHISEEGVEGLTRTYTEWAGT